eukprot:560860_1
MFLIEKHLGKMTHHYRYSLQQSLLIESTVDHIHIGIRTPKSTSICTKCLHYCSLPLDCLLWPITRCMKASCWNRHRHFQYDLSIQLMGIYQVVIGALWASSILSFIESYDQSSSTSTLYVGIYCMITYIACNIVVVIMQRNQYFDNKMSFYVGTLGHVVGFGVKSLAFQIMETYFSSNFQQSFLYFWICLAISIAMIYAMSFIRKRLCFSIKTLQEQTSKRHVKMSTIPSIRHTINSIDSSNDIQLYEDDFTDLLLNNDRHTIDERNHNSQQHEKESFTHLIKEIDTDIYTITMGCIFVELIYYAMVGEYAQLDEQHHSDEILDTTDKDLCIPVWCPGVWITMTTVASVIYLLFRISNCLFSSIQMRRDRVLYHMLQTLEDSTENIQCITQDLQIDENLVIAGCIKFSLKWHKLSQHITTFFVGFLGYGFGWAIVYRIYLLDTVQSRWTYSLVITGIFIVVYFIRSALLKRRYDRWEKSVQQSMEEQHDRHVLGEEMKDKDDIVHEMDMFEMKAKHHRKLYSISNKNFFFRKAYGLAIALPWEVTFDLVIEHMVHDMTMENAVFVRFGIAIGATIVFGYCGVQFIDIHSKVQQHSTSYATEQLLKGNYMKMKTFVRPVYAR